MLGRPEPSDGRQGDLGTPERATSANAVPPRSRHCQWQPNRRHAAAPRGKGLARTGPPCRTGSRNGGAHSKVRRAVIVPDIPSQSSPMAPSWVRFPGCAQPLSYSLSSSARSRTAHAAFGLTARLSESLAPGWCRVLGVRASRSGSRKGDGDPVRRQQRPSDVMMSPRSIKEQCECAR